MGNRNTRIYGDQIDDSLVGLALVKNTTDDFSHKLDVNVDDSTVEVLSNALQVKDSGITTIKIADDAVDKDKINADVAGNGLGQNVDGSLEVNVDDASIEIITDTLQIKDDGVTEAKLDILNAPADGNVLTWNATSSRFEWTDLDVDFVSDNDLVFHEIPTGAIDSANTIYTLASTPIAGTVQVFLNGLLQSPGSGQDYTVSGSTITFVKAPRTNSVLYVHYVTA